MSSMCPYVCDNKTVGGYCRTTFCINPTHSNIGTAQYGQSVQKCIATKYKEDCKWYDYWQDMGARIPFCKAGKNMDASGFFLETCDGCKDYGNKNVITNADRIRAMSDEELADWLCHIVSNETVNCSNCIVQEYCKMGRNGFIKWLKQEVGI